MEAIAQDYQKRFVWPLMHKEVADFLKHCIPCQKSKEPALQQYTLTTQRFEHIKLDLIGPLPQSGRFRHCLTVIDRYTR